MSAYGYVEFLAIAVWMAVHSLVHVLPLFLALLTVFAGLPLVSRLRMHRVTVRN
jgi:hypothetical protein